MSLSLHVRHDFRGHVEMWPFLSAIEFPEFSEILEAAGFSAPFLYATSLPVTSSS